MLELGSIGGNKMDAAAALRQPPPVRTYNNTVKTVMRMLKRSHSASPATENTPMEKFRISPLKNHHNSQHNRNHVGHNQYKNNENLLEEPRVVNCIEGLPFVMGNKKKVVSWICIRRSLKLLNLCFLCVYYI